MVRRLGMWVKNTRVNWRDSVAMAAASTAFTVAGFEWHPIAGWVVVGVGILVTQAAAEPAKAR